MRKNLLHVSPIASDGLLAIFSILRHIEVPPPMSSFIFTAQVGRDCWKQRVELENWEKPSRPSPALHTGKSSIRRLWCTNRTVVRVKPKPTSTPDVWSWISVCDMFLAHFNICYLFWSFKNLTVQSSLGICGEISFSNPAAAAVKSLQSCQTLCDPIDGSPPGSPIPGDSKISGCSSS